MVYYVIEGIDSSGKTTQWNLLKKRVDGVSLNEAKSAPRNRAIFINEPSRDTPLGRAARDMVLHKDMGISAKSAFFLFLAHRRDLFERLNGCPNVVISDRSFLSGAAYGGYDIDSALRMNIGALDFDPPRKIVFLRVSREELQRRMDSKKLDNIESSGIDNLLNIQDRLRLAIYRYKEYIKSTLPSLDIGIKEIDSNLSIDSAHRVIYEFLFKG